MGLMILDTLWKLRREHLHSIASSSSSSSSSSSHETMFMTFSVCISLHALSVFCEKKFNKPTKVWLQLECAGRVHMHKTPVNKALKIWALLQRVCCCCRKCVPFFVWTRSFITHTGSGRLHKFPCTNPAAKREKKPTHTHTHTHTKWSDSNKFCWPKDWVPEPASTDIAQSEPTTNPRHHPSLPRG
jgi:hypothetical protein